MRTLKDPKDCPGCGRDLKVVFGEQVLAWNGKPIDQTEVIPPFFDRCLCGESILFDDVPTTMRM